MYKAFKGTYLVRSYLDNKKAEKGFIRIVNKSEYILDNYVGYYSLNSNRVNLFIQDDLKIESDILYLSELITSIEPMSYEEIFNMINHIKTSKEFLKKNSGKCINFRDVIQLRCNTDDKDIFVNRLYTCLLFYDDYI